VDGRTRPDARRQAAARRRVLRPLSRPSARRLLLLLLPGGQSPRREDLTEQTFLQAYRHFERAQRESNGRPLRPWLIRIAHNLAANYYRDRSRKPQTPIDDAGALSSPHSTETLVEDREDLKRILECVQELPDDRREALIMRFALGMDNREIARALGRTDGATKVLLHRSIRQLEQLVSKAEGPTEPPAAPAAA
jgi:RNA polymerase sigma-70 factor (ECF subfamily)